MYGAAAGEIIGSSAGSRGSATRRGGAKLGKAVWKLAPAEPGDKKGAPGEGASELEDVSNVVFGEAE